MRTIVEVVGGGRRLRPMAALAAVVLVAAACGGDGDDKDRPAKAQESPAPAGGSEADATPKTEVVLQMTDALRFRPERIVLKVGG